MEDFEIIYGIHPVEEALQSSVKITKLLIKKSKEYNPKINQIILTAQVKSIKIKYVPDDALEQYAPSKNHQGIIAFLEHEKKNLQYDFSKNLYLMIDHITDIHNLGAILRSAEFFNVDGVILPKDRNASVNDVVAKTSAGAINYLNMITVTNLNNEIRKFKENDFWLVGADVQGDKTMYEFEFPKKSLIVVGNEEKGISPLIKEQLDYRIAIPRLGHVDSLNVSVATAIFLYGYRKYYK